MIASDALNEPQEEEIPKGDDVDKELKAAQDAAKAAGDVAKNVFGTWCILFVKKVSKILKLNAGGMMGMGGNLMGKAVSKVSGKDEKKEEEEREEHHKPKFVKHLNKTRTMSAKQKWEWAFDKILTVSESNF